MDKVIQVVFYKLDSGREPVREWLKALPLKDRKIIGTDIKTVEFGWPLGLPLVKSLAKGIWEVRSTLSSHRIVRVLFCMKAHRMVLLHGFIKKMQKTPTADLALAMSQMKILK